MSMTSNISNLSTMSNRSARARAAITGDAPAMPPTKLHVYCQKGEYK